jgi:hypothetical protein
MKLLARLLFWLACGDGTSPYYEATFPTRASRPPITAHRGESPRKAMSRLSETWKEKAW